MKLIDFLIGLTLMNAMPHFVLGVWKARMISAFGFGNTQNIIYGLLNFVVAMSLYIYEYGVDQILDNGIFVGALSVLVIYFITGKFWRDLFNKKMK